MMAISMHNYFKFHCYICVDVVTNNAQSYRIIQEVIARGGARRRSDTNPDAANANDDDGILFGSIHFISMDVDAFGFLRALDENENEVSRELAAQRRALKKACLVVLFIRIL